MLAWVFLYNQLLVHGHLNFNMEFKGNEAHFFHNRLDEIVIFS